MRSMPAVGGGGVKNLIGELAESRDLSEDAHHVISVAGFWGADEHEGAWPVYLIAAIHDMGWMGPLLEIDLDDSAEDWARRTARRHRGARELRRIDAQSRQLLVQAIGYGGDKPLTVPHLLYTALIYRDADGRREPPAEVWSGGLLPRPAGLRDPGKLRDLAVRHLTQAHPEFRQRPPTIDPLEAAAAVGAFEAPLRILAEQAQDAEMADWDAEFVRNTLEQIHLWRQRPEANPQIFELLIADLVRQFLSQLTNTDSLREVLLDQGATEDLADDVAAQMADAVRAMAGLGNDDAHQDAAQLDRIATAAEEISEEIGRLADEGGPESEQLRDVMAKSAAAEFGTRIGQGAAAGIGALGFLVVSEWATVQLGLLAAWHFVRGIFL